MPMVWYVSMAFYLFFFLHVSGYVQWLSCDMAERAKQAQNSLLQRCVHLHLRSLWPIVRV